VSGEEALPTHPEDKIVCAGTKGKNVNVRYEIGGKLSALPRKKDTAPHPNKHLKGRATASKRGRVGEVMDWSNICWKKVGPWGKSQTNSRKGKRLFDVTRREEDKSTSKKKIEERGG